MQILKAQKVANKQYNPVIVAWLSRVFAIHCIFVYKVQTLHRHAVKSFDNFYKFSVNNIEMLINHVVLYTIAILVLIYLMLYLYDYKFLLNKKTRNVVVFKTAISNLFPFVNNHLVLTVLIFPSYFYCRVFSTVYLRLQCLDQIELPASFFDIVLFLLLLMCMT